MLQMPPPQRMIKPDAFNKYVYDQMYSGMKQKKPDAPYIDYSSVDNMKLEQKVQFLKGKDFDPTKLTDPRDEINAWMYRWKGYSDHIQKNLLDYKGGQRNLDIIAAQFYENKLAPAYKRLGMPPMDEETWIKSAYDAGQHYDLDYHYSDQATYGFRTGLYGLGNIAAQGAKTIHNILGAFFSPPVPITDENWQKQKDKAASKGTGLVGFFQDLQALSETNHLWDAKKVNERLDTISRNMEVSQALRPMRTFTEKATSFVMEQVPFLALAALTPPAGAEAEFTALGLGEATAGAAAAAPSMEESILTSMNALAGSGIRGKMAEAAARAGTEGLLYGGLTRKTEDKNKAFEDALMWAATSAGISAITGVGGKLIQSVGKRFFDRGRGFEGGSPGPKDYTPQGGGFFDRKALPSPAELARREPLEGDYVGEPPIGLLPEAGIQNAEHEMVQQQRMLIDGREPVTAHEIEELSEAGVAETVAEHGGVGQEIINNAAAAHLIKMEKSGMTEEQIRAYEQNLFKTGDKQSKDMLDAVTRIRGALGDNVITNLSKEEKANFIVQLQTLTDRASKRMLKYLPGLQEALRRRITSYPSAKLDQDFIKHLLPEVMSKLPQNASPEQIADAIKNRLADAVIDMHKYADEQATTDFREEARTVEKKRAAALKKTKAPTSFSEVTRRTTSSKGEPGVSYSYNPQWITYAKKAAKAAGKSWTNADIKEWVDDLDSDDFAADIHAYFIPKFLKDVDLRFERKGGARKGYDYSNLYAFAWNFRDQMPTQYAERLEEEFMNSSKMSNFYEQIKKSSKLTPEQKKQAADSLIRKQSLAMWNHVDNFLNSGHFPKESHIFASTNSYANNPTVWMEQLFTEREQYENKIIDSMFKTSTPSNKIAKTAIKVMMAERRQAYKEGELGKVKQISKVIKERMLAPGPRGGRSRAEGKVIPLYGTKESSRYKMPFSQETITKMLEYNKEANPIKEHQRSLTERMTELTQEHAQIRSTDPAKANQLREEYLRHSAENQKYEEQLRDLRAKHGSSFSGVKVTSRGPYGTVILDDYGKVGLWLSDQMMNTYMQVVHGETEAESVGFRAMNIGRNSKGAVLQRINTDPILSNSEKAGLDRVVRDAFSKAGPEGVNIYRAGQKVEELIGTYAEETTHGWQRSLGYRAAPGAQDELKYHLDEYHYDMLYDKMPDQMKHYLRVVYDKADQKVHVVEATAKLISRGPDMYYDHFRGTYPKDIDRLDHAFKISDQEAKDYLYDYFTILLNKHGDDALDSLTTATGVAEKLRREMIGRAKPGTRPAASTAVRGFRRGTQQLPNP